MHDTKTSNHLVLAINFWKSHLVGTGIVGLTQGETMDIQKLTDSLKPWLAPDTWHTGHPLDDQRFHKALKAAFDDQGIQISSDDFRQAIIQGLTDYRPGDVKAYAEDIEGFAQRAEDIASYLFDIKR